MIPRREYENIVHSLHAEVMGFERRIERIKESIQSLLNDLHEN